jgi:acyl-CoA thioesterase FadM
MLRYLFRLICLLLNLIIKPGKLEISGTSITKGRVWPRDMDINFHLNNGSMMTLMDFGRYDFIIRGGLLKPMMKHKWKPMVGYSMLRFRRPLPPFAPFELHTKMLCWDEKYVYFEQTVFYKKKAAAVLYTMALFRVPGMNIPTSEIFNVLNINPKKPAIPKIIKQWRAMEIDAEIKNNKDKK